ncbi:MAG: mechanosensitive ion channel protein MscS [Deltaproteobacteria bacterium]|nr:MAG: mechanosensitive ion channel protein MscS [Deltaproteobacteria bacterium]
MRICFHGLFAILLSVIFSLTCQAVEAGAPGEAGGKIVGEAGTNVTEPAGKLLDLSNPAAILHPESYINMLNAAKTWCLAHGPGIVVALIILIVGRWLARWFSALSNKAMARGNVDETLARFLGKLLYYGLLAAVIMTAADQAGIRTTSFLAIFGAASLAIGLALKDSLANFASGVMLILFQPFKVGDTVSVGGLTGKVQQVDMFSTIIMTPDNQKIIIPNGSITSEVITNINAETTRRVDLNIGIGYDDDLRRAKDILGDLLHQDNRILADPAPVILLWELADSSVNLVVRAWVRTEDYWNVRCDLLERIKLTFDEKGISFPYPQQDVHIHQVPLQ